MGAIVRAARQILGASPENPSTNLSNPAEWLYTALGATPSNSGISVSERTALACTAVFRCVSLIANTIASLPLHVHKVTKDGTTEIARQHRLDPILHGQPNPMISSYTFRQLITTSLLTTGNGYAVIDRTRGQVSGLYPVESHSVEVAREKGRLKYSITLPDGTEEVDQVDMIHVPGLGFDGVRGMSVIQAVGKEAIGLSLVMERFVARLHKNSSIARGVIEAPNELKPETWKNLLDGLKKLLTQEDAIAVPLDSGMKWNSVTISPDDVQTIEERRFQVAEICRIFGVPPHMAGETEKSTSWGSGLEQQVLGFVKFTLRPWLVSIEQEFNRKLFRKPPYFCEFALDGLLRGDSKTQAEIAQFEVQNAIRTPNEHRRLRNLPPQEGGDVLLANGALTPITLLGTTKGGPDANPNGSNVPPV